MVLDQQRQLELELNTETNVCPEGRLELWLSVQIWLLVLSWENTKFLMFAG